MPVRSVSWLQNCACPDSAFGQSKYRKSTTQRLAHIFHANFATAGLVYFENFWNPVETDENPLGTKGVGELGITGSPAAVMNAISDALRPLGITDIQMPATSENLWRLIRKAS